MNSKKILIFIDWYKPGFKAGGPIRSISNLVSQLNNKYDFHIVTRNTDYLETTPYPTIKSDKWVVVDQVPVIYLSENNTSKSSIKKIIQEINPHIVYCNSLYSPKFTLLPIYIAKKLNIKTVLAIRGMLSEGSLSVKNNKKRIFLAFIKAYRLFSNTIFHATTGDEKNDILNNIGNKSNIIIAQNLPENKNIPFQSKSKTVNQLKMAFVGRISPEKNTLYAIEALMNCKQQVFLDIYGPIYNKEYFELCKNAINQLPSNIVVTYKGILNHEVLDETLNNYHVLYSPSTGENFGHSILEGMINSCIPVISNKTPWQNLENKKVGFDIDLNDKMKFATKLDSLAKLNETELINFSKNAYEYAYQIVNNNKLKEDYQNLFN